MTNQEGQKSILTNCRFEVSKKTISNLFFAKSQKGPTRCRAPRLSADAMTTAVAATAATSTMTTAVAAKATAATSTMAKAVAEQQQ